MKTMKLKSIIIAAVALTGFVGNAKADTAKLTAADGWTKITTVPSSSDIANNYYVFVDNSNDLMLGTAKGVNQSTKWYSLGVYYQTSVEPTSADINGKTWTLESYDGGFAMRNLEYSIFCFQTEWNANYRWDTNDVQNPNEWAKINLAYSDGSWTIENGHDVGNYIGPWTGGNFTNGAECAGNKTAVGEIGKFQIYAISRTQFKQNLLDNASSSNPVDLTPWYVTNATFDAGNRTGWTEAGSGGNNNTSYGGGCEIWHRSNFNIYQNISTPNGKYKVSLQIAGTTGVGQVYGTSGSTTKTVTNSAAAGDNFQNTVLSMIQDRTFGQVITDEIEVSNGALQMGMKCETTDQWLVFDNFKLYCTGVDLSAYESQLSDLVDECNDFINSDVVPTACETAISSAITTYNQSYETAKEYSTAIVALTAVLNTYKNDSELQAAYAAYKEFRSTVQDLENTSNYNYTDPGTAKSTFDGAISSANTAVEAATTASAINTQTANIRAAALTFISSVTAEDGNPFNITFLASQAISDWKKKDGSAAGEVTWAVSNRGDLSFAENYEGTAATTGTVLYQTISNLPAGYYRVGMYAMAAYTPGRDIATEATEGDADRSYAFAGDLGDAGSIQRTGIAIPFKSSFDLSELTTLDVNVHLSSDGDLTYGVQKDANGSNWHFAQIMSVLYSNAPDLTALKATRDALVSEATGLKNGEDADYLTDAQKDALQDAIDDGEAADDYDELNTVTLTALPNAINTAKQQISTVKTNRVLMIAALERFESDYNLADGTDYRRSTMSAKAWTDLLSAVNGVTTALDDVSQAASYGTLKDALVAQMDATDASLRLFKNYKAMVDGTTALSIVGGYGADSNMDTDAKENTAIAALNTAFTTYATAQTDDFDASAFLGNNLDFSAAAGSVINNDNSNTIKNVTGWEVYYANADTWAVLQTDQSDNSGKLYIRKNWGSSATTLTVLKQKILPVGKYRLSLSWNSDMANMTNRSCYKLGEATTAIGQATDGAQTLTYDFEVTDAATPFDLVIGFQKQNTGNSPAQIIVDDVTLTALGVNNILLGEYTPETAEFDATGYSAASSVTLEPTNLNQIIYANAGQLTNTSNVVIDDVCANFVVTDKCDIHTTSEFTATASSYTRTMAASTQYGTLILPYPIDVAASDVNFYTLRTTDAENMTFTPVTTDAIAANTPLLFKKKNSTATSITVNGIASSDIAAIEDASIGKTQGEESWTAKGFYQGDDDMDATVSDTYYISGDKFWKATGTLNMQPFRVVFVAPSSGARSFIINIDENPTGISSLGTKEEDVMKDGKYIDNGQIVIVKNGVKYRANGQILK